MCVHMCVHACVCVCAHMCAHACVCVCACVCMHVFVCVVHAHMCVDMEDARCPTLSIFDLTSSLDKGSLTGA